MAWGDYGVSHRLRLQNNTQNWANGGVPFNMPVQQTGILESLRVITTGTATVTLGGGTAARDVLAPGNLYTNWYVAPNQQAPVVQLSGLGLWLVNQVTSIDFQPNTPDTSIVSATSAATAADIYAFPTSTGALRNWQRIPIAQRVRSLGGMVGMWPLQNPAVQLGVQFTPNSATGASPYNIYSTTAGAAPYLVTGAATVTLTSPAVELVRNMWEVPPDPANLPPFNVVSTWIEESPQGANVNSATKIQWQATPLIGLLVRLGIYIFDGTTGAGVASALLNTANSLLISYDADTPKFSESAYDALARQREFYGFDLEQGFFFWDLMGADSTLQDTLDTNTIANIKLTVNLSSALGASNSSARVIRQILAPLEIR